MLLHKDDLAVWKYYPETVFNKSESCYHKYGCYSDWSIFQHHENYMWISCVRIFSNTQLMCISSIHFLFISLFLTVKCCLTVIIRHHFRFPGNTSSYLWPSSPGICFTSDNPNKVQINHKQNEKKKNTENCIITQKLVIDYQFGTNFQFCRSWICDRRCRCDRPSASNENLFSLIYIKIK